MELSTDYVVEGPRSSQSDVFYVGLSINKVVSS
jgi:hypothetical protein